MFFFLTLTVLHLKIVLTQLCILKHAHCFLYFIFVLKIMHFLHLKNLLQSLLKRVSTNCFFILLLRNARSLYKTLASTYSFLIESPALLRRKFQSLFSYSGDSLKEQLDSRSRAMSFSVPKQRKKVWAISLLDQSNTEYKSHTLCFKRSSRR